MQDFIVKYTYMRDKYLKMFLRNTKKDKKHMHWKIFLIKSQCVYTQEKFTSKCKKCRKTKKNYKIRKKKQRKKINIEGKKSLKCFLGSTNLMF